MFKAISNAREAAANRMTILGGLEYSRLEEAIHVDMQLLPIDILTALDDGTKKLIGFLGGWTWALAPAKEQGISWLEMTIMFFLHGGTQSDLGFDHRHEGQTGHSLRTVLCAFMRIMRAIVKIHVVPHSQVFFKASKSTGLRCKSIGYRNHCACITGLPALGDDQAIQLIQYMV